MGGLILINSDICIGIVKKGLLKDILQNADLNNITNIGYYFVHNGNINAPQKNMWYYMEVYNFGGGLYVLQRATYWTNPKIVYARVMADNGWSEWSLI